MEYVEIARAESERGEIVLRERREPDAPEDSQGVLELRVNGVFVMDTRETSSEKLLANAALKRTENPAVVLIGGLGLGFTMHEVLADHRVEKVVVVEVEDALVQWMRDGTIPHGPAYLADDRLTVIASDIRFALAEATPAAYDLVLLDVDNGPDFLVHDANAEVYQRQVLQRTRECLRRGGSLVIWSSGEARRLAEEMKAVFGNAASIPQEVTLQGRQERYWLYLSRR